MITNYEDVTAPTVQQTVSLKGIACLREKPDPSATLDSQIIFGERVTIRGMNGDWYDCVVDFCGFDRTGFIHMSELGDTATPPTHRVSVPWAPLLSLPNVRGDELDRLPKCSLLRIVAEEKFHYHVWPRGVVYKSHVQALGAPAEDYLLAMRSLLGVPYIWGGRSTFGLDCAGFIELSMLLAGLRCPRARADMPGFFGPPLEAGQMPRAGDIIVFPKHCAIFLDEDRVMHASGSAGEVVEETLVELQGYLQCLGFETDYVHLRPSMVDER